MTDLELIRESVAKHAANILDANDRIWDYAELAFHEHKSAELLCQLLEAEGFTVQRGLDVYKRQAPLPDAEGPQIGAGRQHPVPYLGCARAVGVKGLVLLKPSLLQRLNRNAAAKAVVEVEQLLEPQGKIRRHREIRRIIPAGDGLRENDPPFGQGTQLDAPMPGLHAGFPKDTNFILIYKHFQEKFLRK